ncbi:MAG: TonB-dependent receptor [Alteromonas macleodii]|jgi:iron complex outermembrane receptor protein|uniref:TonB-dependent receptor n=1 Tax=Alteromonas TaxID=226 RepID=UPI001287DFC4|nr:TonB-dependent receptor [Alteromonas macleodii]MEC8966623.1 TonB-dependent receptor [Pseudomonadota bacterium]MDM7962452.1 TonB-dependent receptor [Alteromonas macleodii]MDM8170737.1 TonB-dependent receptor [Alteromonas macleodii]CAI2391403.1 iron complex outermembrane recepter protein [Alteromonas macleodii]CAI3966434.1 iron complex outermembrane recepter protein [Alteromonas macleodii]
MHTLNTHKRLLALTVAMALSTPAAFAAENVWESIEVTAQKRNENISDVGIAITAFSGEQLEALGLESSTELIAFTPGVSLAGDIGGQRAIFNIRGVVQNDYADLAEAPVAVYVDGGYLASTQAQTFGLFDVARIEILKGPQGTLFGRNATGGLVNTITAKPTADTEGYAEFTAARFEQYRFEGAISGEITDGIYGRFSGFTNQQGEILENIYEDGAAPDTRLGSVGGGEDGYNDDTKAFRAQLLFDIGEEGSLLLSGNWSDTTKSEGPYQVVNTTEIKDADGNVIDVIYAADDPLGCDTIQAGVCVDGNFNGDPFRPVQGGDFNGNFDPDGSGNKVNKDFAFDDQNKIKSKGLAATLDYAFESFDFFAMSDFKEFKRTVGLDSDQTASPELIFQSNSTIEQFSQEFRFSGESADLKWVGGLYYLSIDTDYSQGLAGSPTTFFLGGEENNTLVSLETESYSVFGQIDYSLTDDLVLVGGLRYTREDKDFVGNVYQNENTNDRVIEIDTTTTSLETLVDSNDQNLWSAKLQLEYSVGNSLYYAGINRGVKAGSFNAPLQGGFSLYEPEELTAFEAGLKHSFMQGSGVFNANVFYYDYSDYQSFSWVNNAGVVSNEEASFSGVELEVFLTPTDSLDVMVNFSYTDAVVEDLEVASGYFADTTPPFTPEYQASAMLRYNWDAFDGNMAAQLSANYQSETFHNARNFTAHEIDSFATADTRLTWVDAEDKWLIAAYVDNLFDSDHELIGFDVTGFYGTSQISYAKPRTYGVTIRRNF